MRTFADSRLAAVLLAASSAFALPQAVPSSTSASLSRGTIIGSIAPATTSSSASLPSSFLIPGATPTRYQNTSNLPSTPLEDSNPALPAFAIQYAPIMYLHQDEQYWPSAWDIHLSHTFPWIDYKPLDNVPNPLTLENLNFTTSYSLYLSIDNPAQQPRPEWLYSTYGQPNATGFSVANTTVIAVNKSASIAPGYVDVFYFYLYSFNEGDNVGGATYGNHISDIELVMIRFLNGEPRFMYFSQHQDGTAYEWQALQKDENGRPIGYVALGGHANYPVAGTFELVPGLIGLLEDKTSAGWRWDIAQNYNAYWYSKVDGFVKAGGRNASTQPNGPPDIGYLQQTGKWGNQALPADDPNQMKIFGQEAWSDGGTGPIDPSKALSRTWLCVQSNCPVNASLPDSSALQAGQLAVAVNDAHRSIPMLGFVSLVSTLSVLWMLC